jgi:serine/threonine protein kinase
MSPELFTAGHISKASDVYAFGVLLYEVITGQRAYAGVPIPLLPHEVAVQGLRPTWPEGMPPGCRDLRKLAEACWAHNPQDRPSFAEILRTLDIWASGGHGWPATPPASSVRTQRRQQQQQPVEQQQQQPMEQQPAGRGGQPAQPLPQQPQQQVRWQAAAPSHPLPAQPPAAGGVERDQQQRHPPERSGARGAADAPAARNRQMSWSEVDFRES